MAINRLRSRNHPVIAVGRKSGTVADVKLLTQTKDIEDLDTITLYLNPANQKEYYEYILGSKAKRIIFNPGTENEELEQLARMNGIEPVEACTLVLLSTGQY